MICNLYFKHAQILNNKYRLISLYREVEWHYFYLLGLIIFLFHDLFFLILLNSDTTDTWFKDFDYTFLRVQYIYTFEYF